MMTPKTILFKDSFANNQNNWEQRNDATAKLEIANSTYLIEHRQEGKVFPVTSPVNLSEGADYEIQATLQKVSGVDNYGFGLVWGMQDSNNFYTFQISNEGQYRLSQLVKGEWQVQRAWTDTPRLKKYNLANKLAIRQTGAQTSFYINEQLVDTLTFPFDGFGKQIGFIVSSVMTIKVYNLVVTQFDTVGQASCLSTTDRQDARPTATAEQKTAEKPKEPEETLEQVLAQLHGLIGLANIKEQINTFINFLKVQQERQKRGLSKTSVSLHMVLCGPPGTGKTTVARLIGKIYKHLGFLAKGQLIETDRAGLVGGYVGQTALKVDEKVKEALGGVLFIDEAYTLKPAGATSDFGQEAIDILLKRMEDQRGEIAVVIAGYPDEMDRFLEANPGIKSRFSRYFLFEHYSPADLFRIYEKFCQEGSYKLTEEATKRVEEVIKVAYDQRDRTFGNGRFARNLFEQTLEQQANRLATITPLTDELLNTFTVEDIPDDILLDTVIV